YRGGILLYNLIIWDAVKETDPRFTKKVSFGARQFTSIDAHYQIRRATEYFGPIGQGWKYDCVYSTESVGAVCFQFADLTIHWKKDEWHTYGPVRGCNMLVTTKGAVDEKYIGNVDKSKVTEVK
ncbi:MAG: hypothetical protein ACO3UU_17225, partial [Minisyncoccia bacterium]